MCISAKVPDRVAETIECLLYKRTPVFKVKAVAEGLPFKRMSEMPAVIRKRETAGVISIIKRSEKFSLKFITKNKNRDKEPVFGLTELIVFGQAAAGYAERAAAEILEAALSALEDLAAQDPEAAARLKKQFFQAASDSPVTYEGGEPVQL